MPKVLKAILKAGQEYGRRVSTATLNMVLKVRDVAIKSKQHAGSMILPPLPEHLFRCLMSHGAVTGTTHNPTVSN